MISKNCSSIKKYSKVNKVSKKMILKNYPGIKIIRRFKNVHMIVKFLKIIHDFKKLFIKQEKV
jgi:hypothetical protein